MAIVVAPALPATEPVDVDEPQACARLDEHRRLTGLAVKWLRRANSAGGHGCQVALSEGWAGWGGEIPDAIGFRGAGYQNGTVVVEAKASRADFLADARKPHRLKPETGLGRWRYYICPEGLIDPAELPDRWGLLHVTSRGAIRAVAGAAAALRKSNGMFHSGRYAESLDEHAFPVRDVEREISILVHTLARVGDAELLNARLREANSRAARLLQANQALEREVRGLRMHKLLSNLTLATGAPGSTDLASSTT